ncbi:hypothetical protein GBK02_10265 [Dechloromonas sp. TW-R-39-2]|uniref:hypothetical protein n=1 Tax=Dechloromonas sp. TW-R-39-2 TaxID=2654218 RepID=UPI00193E75BC|nr:hypothetical protein [Dechloromonas sp. TW-R-39-2]QRM19758.1 hypothetical protein GBK02_10265 [Dechloromonas sp. TW-R-39-2]
MKNTDLVKVLQVTDFPFPEDRLLGDAVKAMGLLGNGVIGITLGYGILIREGHYSERLLAHECRHIYQFEQAGSLDSFLMAYVRGVNKYG